MEFGLLLGDEFTLTLDISTILLAFLWIANVVPFSRTVLFKQHNIMYSVPLDVAQDYAKKRARKEACAQESLRAKKGVRKEACAQRSMCIYIAMLLKRVNVDN